MFAKIENDIVLEWPIYDIRPLFPNVSFPDGFPRECIPAPYYKVDPPEPKPIVDKYHEAVISGIEKYGYMRWRESWKIVAKNKEDVDAQILADLTNEVQNYMDMKASTYGYDSILSMCSYAPCVGTKFGDEGMRATIWRGEVWAKCYEIMDLVKNGEREIPTKEELLTELPTFECSD